MSRYDQYQDVRIYCARGEQMPQAKLTVLQVYEIRRRYKPYSRINGAKALAREFKVHFNTILNITGHSSWIHVREAA